MTGSAGFYFLAIVTIGGLGLGCSRTVTSIRGTFKAPKTIRDIRLRFDPFTVSFYRDRQLLGSCEYRQERRTLVFAGDCIFGNFYVLHSGKVEAEDTLVIRCATIGPFSTSPIFDQDWENVRFTKLAKE